MATLTEKWARRAVKRYESAVLTRAKHVAGWRRKGGEWVFFRKPLSPNRKLAPLPSHITANYALARDFLQGIKK